MYHPVFNTHTLNFLFIQSLSTIFLIMMMNYKTVENVYLCWTGSLVLNWLACDTLWYNSENFIKLFMPKNVDIQLAIFIHAHSRLYFCRHTLWDFISPCICHIFFKFIAQPIDSTSLLFYMRIRLITTVMQQNTGFEN